MTIDAASNVHPLDTLLVQQLTYLIEGEKSLATKYPTLASPLDTSEARVAFSKELGQLKQKADRLQRLVEAMEHMGFCPSDLVEATPTFVA